MIFIFKDEDSTQDEDEDEDEDVETYETWTRLACDVSRVRHVSDTDTRRTRENPCPTRQMKCSIF